MATLTDLLTSKIPPHSLEAERAVLGAILGHGLDAVLAGTFIGLIAGLVINAWRKSRESRRGTVTATSATPACGRADFTQPIKVSTSSSNIAVPPIASGSIMIDSMLLMIAVPSFLMVRGLCVRPPVSAPASRSQIIASPPPLCRPNGRMAP